MAEEAAAPIAVVAASIAPADSQDQVGVQPAAALQRDRLPGDPIAQHLPRQPIRVLAPPMRALAQIRIARRPLHTADQEMRIERQLGIAGQPASEGARRVHLPRM
jgi:hypothetical protein